MADAAGVGSDPNLTKGIVLGGGVYVSTNSDDEMIHAEFASALVDENLWLVQSGYDLTIDLLGTSASVTVKDWFSSTSNQLQEIDAGGLKIEGEVSQLVQAMATYSANNTGFDPTNSSIQALPSDIALQNAVAAAWHA